jgi:CubicO group peptidase (beta-lactamase class C family)
VRTALPDFATLDDFMSAEAADRDFSGVIRICSGPGVLFTGAYGPASRRWPIPVTEDMRFDVASVTKLFTSVAVLQQVAAGALHLDASIMEYVDLSGTTISDRVTLRQLLTHTSGIADDADEEAGESYEEVWRDRPNYSVTDTVDFLPQFAYKPPVFEPGAGCRYCNCGYVLAGLALERVTGESYREYVHAHVFDPAGMTRSGFFDMRDAEPDVAEGWEPRDSGWRRNIYSYRRSGHPTAVRTARQPTWCGSYRPFATAYSCRTTSPTRSSALRFGTTRPTRKPSTTVSVWCSSWATVRFAATTRTA